MTATQVFLRFVESEYRNKDGIIDVRKARIWRRELRTNHISSKSKYPLSNNLNQRFIKIMTSKNFVDDYLKKHRSTLNGFLRHFFEERGVWDFQYYYGPTITEGTKRLDRNWKIFLKNHINEEDYLKKYWGKDKIYTFTWKE